jgi:ribosomal 50S subunit-associated protein YjgA (DUF615 family)
MEEHDQCIRMSPLESTPADHSQNTEGLNLNNTDNTMVAHGNLVSHFTESSTTTPVADPTTDGATTSSTSNKRIARESALVAQCLENKIRRLETAGVNENVMDTIMRANPKRYLRYAQFQAKYLAFCRERSMDETQASSVLDFLSHGHVQQKWSLQTLNNYRSSLLDMFANPDDILNYWPLRAYLQAFQDQSLRSDLSRPIDISPIINHFHSLGANHTILLSDLTAKICWLLGVYRFMRPSDIERINLDESICDHYTDKVILKVVGPKEKRLGQRITKEITIQRHDDSLICPSCYCPRISGKTCTPTLPISSSCLTTCDSRLFDSRCSRLPQTNICTTHF